jgi:hypothetical protein
MASTISAGTSAGTAIAISGDTTGNLAFTTQAGANTITVPNSTGTVALTNNAGLSLVKVAGGTLSAASGITVDGVFTSTYKNYIMYINTTLGGGSNDVDIFFQFRASGTTNSSANYAYQTNYINAGLNSGAAASSTGSATSWTLYDNMDDGSIFSGSIQFLNPQVVSETQGQWNLCGADNGYRKQMLGFGSLNAVSSFDGINLYLSGGNLTGTYDIYGVAR